MTNLLYHCFILKKVFFSMGITCQDTMIVFKCFEILELGIESIDHFDLV